MAEPNEDKLVDDAGNEQIAIIGIIQRGSLAATRCKSYHQGSSRVHANGPQIRKLETFWETMMGIDETARKPLKSGNVAVYKPLKSESTKLLAQNHKLAANQLLRK